MPYWDAAKRPMQVLALVLPLCVAYEALLAAGMHDAGAVLTNRAHEGILRLFATFGVDGMALGLPVLSIPAVAVAVVLVIWQVVSRDSWKVSPAVWAGTVAESALLSIPLYAAGLLLGLVMASAALSGNDALASGSLSWTARLGLSLGAGLYEELVFRLALVSMLHAVAHDVARLPSGVATAIAVTVAAVAFALYHPIRDASGAIDVRHAAFLMLAGGWFGILFVARGFGIAVGAHAAYDILALSTAAEAGAAAVGS